MPVGVERRGIRYEPPIEPERQEVFLMGTGQDVITLAQAEARPIRIEGPGNGAVLALDPDIPPERQKVGFRAVPARPGLVWKIDGQPADPAWLQADGALLWPPRKGAHRISLLGEDGKELDALFITVK
jgi:penicillin-binding protein 1C